MERFFEEIERAPPIRGIYQVWPTCRHVPLRNIRDFILCYLAKESPDQTVKPKISKTVEKLLVTSLDRDRKTSLRGLAQELWNEERRYNYKPNELQFIGRKIHKGFLAHNNDAKKFPIDSLEEFEGKLSDFLDAARYSLIQRSDAASGYGENANFSSIETENVIAEPFLRSDLALWEKSFDLDEIFNTAIDCYVDFSIASHQALESTECDKLCREIIDRFEDRAKYKGFEEQNDFKEFLKSCSWGFQKVTLAALAKNQAVSGIYRTAIDSLAQLSTREFLENPLHGSTDLADQYNFKAYLSIVRFLINEGRIDELEKYGLNEQRRTEQVKEIASRSNPSNYADVILADPSVKVRLAFIQIATSELLDEVVLKEFAIDPSVEVQLALAENVGINGETLRLLANSTFEKVRAVIALHVNTPTPLLWELFKGSSMIVRRAVCNNPKVPKALFLRSMDKPDSIVKIAADPSLSTEELDQLVDLNVSEISSVIAGNPNASAETLFSLSPTYPKEFFANPVHLLRRLSDPEWDEKIPLTSVKAYYFKLLKEKDPLKFENQGLSLSLRQRMVESQKWEGEEFELFCSDPAPEVRAALLNQCGFNIPDSRMEDFALDPSPLVRKTACKFPLPPRIFLLLSRDPSQIVREEIASGQHPEAGLARLDLADRGNETEQFLLAQNPSSESEIFEKLAKSECPEVRECVAARDFFEAKSAHLHLAETGTLAECMILAKQRNPGAKVLELLARRDEPKLRKVIALHDSSNAHTAQTFLAEHGQFAERKWMAGNKNAGSDALMILAENPEEKVRMAIAGNSSVHAGKAHAYIAENGKNEEKRLLAKNPGIPSRAMWFLCQDKDPRIKNQVIEKLKKLAKSLLNAIENGQLEPYVIGHREARSPEGCILAMNVLAMDTKLSEGDIPAHAQDTLLPEALKMVMRGNLLNRRHLAKDHKTPEGILAILAHDKVRDVLSAVASHPKAQASLFIGKLFRRRKHLASCNKKGCS